MFLQFFSGIFTIAHNNECQLLNEISWTFYGSSGKASLVGTLTHLKFSFIFATYFDHPTTEQRWNCILQCWTFSKFWYNLCFDFNFKFLPFYTFALFLTFFLFSISATLNYFNLLNKVCSTSKVSCARICNNEILFQLWPFWFWWLLLLAFYFNGHHFSNSPSSNPNL